MSFDYTPKVQELRKQLIGFMDQHVYPNEHKWHEHVKSDKRWEPVPVIEELKAKARQAGLWNLWRPKSHGGTLTNFEYAPLCEIMGRVHWAPEVFNCSAPDTGNMEVLARYGTPEQQHRWLTPLLAGEIRSAFAMTEPAVASSDATNIESSIVRDGDEYVVNGRKWYTTNATHPRCEIIIFMRPLHAGGSVGVLVVHLVEQILEAVAVGVVVGSLWVSPDHGHDHSFLVGVRSRMNHI